MTKEAAFAALYESAPGEQVHGGTAAAPMIGELLREVFKAEPPAKKSSDEEQSDEMDEGPPSGNDQSN